MIVLLKICIILSDHLEHNRKMIRAWLDKIRTKGYFLKKEKVKQNENQV